LVWLYVFNLLFFKDLFWLLKSLDFLKAKKQIDLPSKLYVYITILRVVSQLIIWSKFIVFFK